MILFVARFCLLEARWNATWQAEEVGIDRSNQSKLLAHLMECLKTLRGFLQVFDGDVEVGLIAWACTLAAARCHRLLIPCGPLVGLLRLCPCSKRHL